MMVADHSSCSAGIARFFEYASAIFGILGTALMSRRCAPQIFRSMLYAASWPVLFILGQGRRARDFFIARARISWDVPDSPADMTLGLNLLLWAFFLQFISLFLK
jgi:hypothetical protein